LTGYFSPGFAGIFSKVTVAFQFKESLPIGDFCFLSTRRSSTVPVPQRPGLRIFLAPVYFPSLALAVLFFPFPFLCPKHSPPRLVKRGKHPSFLLCPPPRGPPASGLFVPFPGSIFPGFALRLLTFRVKPFVLHYRLPPLV